MVGAGAGAGSAVGAVTGAGSAVGVVAGAGSVVGAGRSAVTGAGAADPARGGPGLALAGRGLIRPFLGVIFWDPEFPLLPCFLNPLGDYDANTPSRTVPNMTSYRLLSVCVFLRL